VIGFYHPYCEVFEKARCAFSAVYPGHSVLDVLLAPFGYPFASLIDNANWGGGTQSMVNELAVGISANRGLLFAHLNAPHLPSSYAQRTLGLRPPLNDAEEYGQGLQAADAILGGVMRQLQAEFSNGSALLIVSSDHWWRSATPRVERPVPLLLWIVGESEGHVLESPLSTVESASLAVDFLWSRVNSQADILRWWSGRPFAAAWMGP
jgi:hypothetical protein